MTRLELEAALENRCVAKVEAAGGMALKLSIPGVRGFPDRTLLLPETGTGPAHVAFMEFKRLKTGKVSSQQHRWRVLLHGMGFSVYFIDDDAGFDEAMKREMGR